jgi:hypothetical protein
MNVANILVLESITAFGLCPQAIPPHAFVSSSLINKQGELCQLIRLPTIIDECGRFLKEKGMSYIFCLRVRVSE